MDQGTPPHGSAVGSRPAHSRRSDKRSSPDLPLRKPFASAQKHRTLEDLAYQTIRRAIAEGRLAPGQRIVVPSIGEAPGVSRTAVMRVRRGGFAKEALEEHGGIVRALDAGDTRRAAMAIEHRRQQSKRRLRETM